MTKGQVKLGYIDIPKDYIDLPKENRIEICDHLIDVLLRKVDKNLAPQYNRVDFLLEVQESSLETNIEEETINVTLRITLDATMPTIPEEPVSAQPKPKQRGGRQKKSDVPDLKEKVACPDCSKTVS